MIQLEMLYFLDWAIIAVSFFNTIALLWLGITVLFNAERHALRTWIAGGGLVVGGLFFVGHTAIVGRIFETFGSEMEFWWQIGWLTFIGAPYLWYVTMASYTGVLHTFWHRVLVTIVSILGFIALGVLAIVNPLPTYGEMMARSPVGIFTIGGIPVVLLVYPVYSVLCIILSLSALRWPVASERFMGDLARERARPWLFAASLVLLGVSLAVGGAVTWVLRGVQARELIVLSVRFLAILMGFDLLISGLIAVAVVLTGKAIVSYEIFTGKTLPRGGLFRHWRNSLILAAGYGTLVGASLSFPSLARPNGIYQVLVATVLMTLFFALLSWRSYAERERSIGHLRPFVASQRLYEHMLHPAAPPDIDIAIPFQALCDDILGAQVAYLAALGAQAALFGDPIAYPSHETPPATLVSKLSVHFESPQTICVPLDPTHSNGAVWGVPLWSERGLIGVLLLGNKRDGGLYTQEEIEIARTAGERLIDIQSSTEMARRLMTLQRQQLAESQVLDRRTRRVLHDDVLPRLHTAMLMLSPANQTVQPHASSAQYSEVVASLADIHHQIANLLHAMPTMASHEVARLGLLGALHRTVDNELGDAFDHVTWQLDPVAEQAASALPALTAEVVFYAAREAIRNAARYGHDGDPSSALHLTITLRCQQGLEIVIEDNGVGIAASERSSGGSGHGLALHSTMMAIVGGTMAVESLPGHYTRVSLTLPKSGEDAIG